MHDYMNMLQILQILDLERSLKVINKASVYRRH